MNEASLCTLFIFSASSHAHMPSASPRYSVMLSMKDSHGQHPLGFLIIRPAIMKT